MRRNVLSITSGFLFVALSVASVGLSAAEEKNKEGPIPKKVEEINKTMSADNKKQKVKKQELAPSKDKPDVIVIP